MGARNRFVDGSSIASDFGAVKSVMILPKITQNGH
jgi:hypothetical protein